MTDQLQAVGRDLILCTLSAIKTLQTHGASNQAVQAAIDRLSTLIEIQLEPLGGRIRLDVIDDMLLLNGVRVRSFGILLEQSQQLVKQFTDRELGGVAIVSAPDPITLRQWLGHFAQRAETPEDRRRLREELASLAPSSLVPLEIRTLTDQAKNETLAVSTMAFAMQTYGRAVLSFRDFAAAISDGRDPYSNRLNVVRVVQDLIDVSQSRADFLLTVLALQRVRRMPRPYREIHAANTCAYSLLLGSMLRLERTELLDLGTGALLAHVPLVLIDPSEHERAQLLSPESKARLRNDSMRAVQALLQTFPIDDAVLIRAIIAYEHARPHLDVAALGAPLHLFSRVVAVCGAFAAMLQPRPWRPAMTEAEAIADLRRDAQKYDPMIVGLLACLHESYGMIQPAA
jgi:HD-GYP domain-containing protein (c-di-GMP phosphodiesterase class II)